MYTPNYNPGAIQPGSPPPPYVPYAGILAPTHQAAASVVPQFQPPPSSIRPQQPQYTPQQVPHYYPPAPSQAQPQQAQHHQAQHAQNQPQHQHQPHQQHQQHPQHPQHQQQPQHQQPHHQPQQQHHHHHQPGANKPPVGYPMFGSPAYPQHHPGHPVMNANHAHPGLHNSHIRLSALQLGRKTLHKAKSAVTSKTGRKIIKGTLKTTVIVGGLAIGVDMADAADGLFDGWGSSGADMSMLGSDGLTGADSFAADPSTSSLLASEYSGGGYSAGDYSGGDYSAVADNSAGVNGVGAAAASPPSTADAMSTQLSQNLQVQNASAFYQPMLNLSSMSATGQP